MGPAALAAKNFIHLASRALYDLTQERKQWQVRKLAHAAERSRISAVYKRQM